MVFRWLMARPCTERQRASCDWKSAAEKSDFVALFGMHGKGMLRRDIDRSHVHAPRHFGALELTNPLQGGEHGPGRHFAPRTELGGIDTGEQGEIPRGLVKGRSVQRPENRRNDHSLLIEVQHRALQQSIRGMRLVNGNLGDRLALGDADDHLPRQDAFDCR